MDRLIALTLLRWRLELRALAWARERLLGFLLVLPGLVLFSGFSALLVFVGVRALEARSPELVLPVASAVVTGLGLFWVLSPVLTGVALGETHDLTRLLHFPIPLPALVGSSLAANLTQPALLAELPIVAALGLGLAGLSPRFPLALGGALLALGFMLAAAQVGGLLLLALARNRRYQDAALFLGLGAGFVLSLAPLLLLGSGPGALSGALRFLVAFDPFALSPFAWGVRAAVHAGRGEPAGFVGFALSAALAIAAALGLSAVLIGRVYRGELELAGPAATRSARPARMRLPGAIGALIEKDLRIAWRDPALKASLLTGLLGPLLLLFVFAQPRALGRSPTAIFVLAAVIGLSSIGSNAFGFERRGIALLLGFPVERWRVLVAKNLAALAFRLPGLLTLMAAGLVLAPLSFLPAAATIAGVTLLLSVAMDNYLSVLFPFSYPEPGRAPVGGAAAGGRGLAAAATAMLFAALAAAASAPFVFLAWLPLLLRATWLWPLALPLALAGAVAVYAMLVAGAARLLGRREPELLERILGEA